MNKIKQHNPPRIAQWLLSRILVDNLWQTPLGDFQEYYNELARERGLFSAWTWYWAQVYKLVVKKTLTSLAWSMAMFKNYFRITLRNFKNHKGYSLINISGLTIGMACCILIVLFIQDEMSYDKHHENGDRIYRILSISEVNGIAREFAISPTALAPAFAEEIPEVESFVRIFSDREVRFKYGDNTFNESGARLVDSTFFNIFSHEFIAGDPDKALSQPNSLVITESVASRVFGNENPIGKIITVPEYGQNPMTVTGVVKSVPKNSHFTFEILAPFSTIPVSQRGFLNNWMSFQAYSFLLLEKGAQPQQVAQKIPPVFERHSGDQLRLEGIKRTYPLQKLTDIHLRSRVEWEIGPQGDIAYVYIFSAIAFFVLFIACINFVNLSTARSANRAKEVGMRKVFGAQKVQLVYQFLGESLLLSAVSLVLAVLLVFLVLPDFNALSGKEMDMQNLLNAPVLFTLISLVLFTGFAAGSFPAFFLSSFRPIMVLKNALGAGSKNSTFRKVLVVGQFSVSIFLIASTIVIYNQLDYVKNKNLGFNKDRLLVIRPNTGVARTKYQTVKNVLLQNENIREVAISADIPGEPTGAVIYLPEGKQPGDTQRAHAFVVDYDFLDTYDIELLYGRSFSEELASDAAQAIIINETMANKIGWREDAIGKRMTKLTQNANQERTVIGVVKDFHHESLKNVIVPTILTVSKQGFWITVRMSGADIAGTMDFLKSKWSEFEPERDFRYYFLDDKFEQLYRAEERAGTVYIYFALIAIFIACLGLFGLASYTAEQRSKEIGIRKVLGAHSKDIVYQLSFDFTKWVLLSNIIAWPLMYYIMNSWMTNFAYRTDIHFWIPVASGAISFVIAIATVIFQALKAAIVNPVKSLKYE